MAVPHADANAHFDISLRLMLDHCPERHKLKMKLTNTLHYLMLRASHQTRFSFFFCSRTVFVYIFADCIRGQTNVQCNNHGDSARHRAGAHTRNKRWIKWTKWETKWIKSNLMLIKCELNEGTVYQSNERCPKWSKGIIHSVNVHVARFWTKLHPFTQSHQQRTPQRWADPTTTASLVILHRVEGRWIFCQ